MKVMCPLLFVFLKELNQIQVRNSKIAEYEMVLTQDDINLLCFYTTF